MSKGIDIRFLLYQYTYTDIKENIDTKYNKRRDKTCQSGSSHYTFRKPGAVPITIPKHEPIKKVYVEMVRQVIESEEKKHENVE